MRSTKGREAWDRIEERGVGAKTRKKLLKMRCGKRMRQAQKEKKSVDIHTISDDSIGLINILTPPRKSGRIP